MPQFKEGDTVALKREDHFQDLSAGKTGVVWMVYQTLPACYEVTFTDKDGKSFDAMMYEEELAPIGIASTLRREPSEVKAA